MADNEGRIGSLSGLTDAEAKEFHRIFVGSFVVFVLIAIVAHLLVWSWRPWIPGVRGYTGLVDGAMDYANLLVAFVA